MRRYIYIYIGRVSLAAANEFYDVAPRVRVYPWIPSPHTPLPCCCLVLLQCYCYGAFLCVDTFVFVCVCVIFILYIAAAPWDVLSNDQYLHVLSPGGQVVCI